MENQHRKIKGYRELSEHEIALMNKIKDHGEQLKELLDEITSLRHNQLQDSYEGVYDPDNIMDSKTHKESMRCLNIAQENLQTGIMWLVRSVALPESF